MTPERWQRVGSILSAAWKLDIAERRNFLKGACGGDPELLADVQALLDSDQKAGEFLSGSPAHEPLVMHTGDTSTISLNGRMLGRYQIVSPVGAGGCGQVYLAKDTHLQCKAAVKILTPTLTKDREQVHRFQQEAHLASTLNHPNIITVLDIGEVDDL